MRTTDAAPADRARFDSAKPPPTVAAKALRRLTCRLAKPALGSPEIMLVICQPTAYCQYQLAIKHFLLRGFFSPSPQPLSFLRPPHHQPASTTAESIQP